MGSIRIATWNVNSVRKRLGLVARLAREAAPDVICLQETKCRDTDFPGGDIRSMGYEHIEIKGQKGYHGVAVLSKLPLGKRQVRDFARTGDSRHISVEVETGAGAGPLVLHNFYVPAGGEEPDPAINPKFRQKLAFLEALAGWGRNLRRRRREAPIMAVGDLNVAPLEQDVWSHKQLLKVVSHTPVEVELFEQARKSGGWEDVMRRFTPNAEKLFTWWSYRARDWRSADRGRRLDHIWVNDRLGPDVTGLQVLKDARGWPEPSDHVPVLIDIKV